MLAIVKQIEIQSRQTRHRPYRNFRKRFKSASNIWIIRSRLRLPWIFFNKYIDCVAPPRNRNTTLDSHIHEFYQKLAVARQDLAL